MFRARLTSHLLLPNNIDLSCFVDLPTSVSSWVLRRFCLQYALKCVDVDPKPESYCENLERNIETLRETDENIGVPIILYFTGDSIVIYRLLVCL